MRKVIRTKEMEALKAALNVADVSGVVPENRQWWLETKVFPYIKQHDPYGVGDLCEFFEISISDYQIWKWLSQMPIGHIEKIRRRIEDRLRKGTPLEIIKVAHMLKVSTESDHKEK